MKKNRLLELFQGKAPKKIHGWLLLFNVVFLFINFLLAQAFYPETYSILNNHISNQGGIARNPDGHLFFTIGAGTAGFLLIPHFLYLYHQLNDERANKDLLLKIATACGIIGCIAFSFVGFILVDIKVPHDQSANFAFGGLGISAVLFLFVLLKKSTKNQIEISKQAIAIIYGISFSLVGLAVIFPNLDFLATSTNIDPRWFSNPPWQWVSFFNVLFWILMVYLIIPGRNRSK